MDEYVDAANQQPTMIQESDLSRQVISRRIVESNLAQLKKLRVEIEKLEALKKRDQREIELHYPDHAFGQKKQSYLGKRSKLQASMQKCKSLTAYKASMTKINKKLKTLKQKEEFLQDKYEQLQDQENGREILVKLETRNLECEKAQILK